MVTVAEGERLRSSSSELVTALLSGHITQVVEAHAVELVRRRVSCRVVLGRERGRSGISLHSE